MNEIAKYLLAQSSSPPLQTNVHVAQISDGWIHDKEGQKFGPYDLIIITMPFPSNSCCASRKAAFSEQIVYFPCRTVLFSVQDERVLNTFKTSDIIEKVIKQPSHEDQSKLGSYVAYLNENWSVEHVDLTNDDALAKICAL